MFEGLTLQLDHDTQRICAKFHFKNEDFLEKLQGVITRPWFEFGDGEPPYWVCGIARINGVRFFIDAFGEDMSLYGDTFTCYVGVEPHIAEDNLGPFEEINVESYWMDFIPVLRFLKTLH